MAKTVMMKNNENGVRRKGFYGFSWTYLFFGWFVPLIRGELGVAVLHFFLAIFSCGIAQLIFCFLYNKQFTQRLLEKGYRFADRPEVNSAAAVAIGVDLSVNAVPA